MTQIPLPLSKRIAMFHRRTTRSNSGCLIYDPTRLGSHGYGLFFPKIYGEFLAHRISYRISKGKITKGMCILHHCDIRPCVEPSHLFEGSKADNNKDMAEKGRTRGGNRKLTPELVLLVKSQIKLDKKAKTIASLSGLSRETVRLIRDGKRDHLLRSI